MNIPYRNEILHYAILVALLLIILPMLSVGIEVSPFSAIAIFLILAVGDTILHKALKI